ncbi:MAG: hypothetical protein KDB90_15620 [Planctomycetes bacterium]|nr:hypothetical protein [Planctomycetota bacterium]
MKAVVLPVIALGLFVSGCASHHCTQQEPTKTTLGSDGLTVTSEPGPEARTLGNLVDDAAKEEASEAEPSRLAMALRIDRWDRMSNNDRKRVLRYLAFKGNQWAAEALKLLAKGYLTREEVRELGDGLRAAVVDVEAADEPELARDPFTNAAEVDDLLTGLGAPRVDGRTAADWRGWDTTRRVDELRKLSREGNNWAGNLLDAIDAGERNAASLDGEALHYELEVRIQSAKESGTYRIKVAGFPIGSGVEPMPFGDSMFGPWDTGLERETP